MSEEIIEEVEKTADLVEEEVNKVNEDVKENVDDISSQDEPTKEVEEVKPIVDVQPQTSKQLDYRLNIKSGSKLVEGDSPINSAIEYQRKLGY